MELFHVEQLSMAEQWCLKGPYRRFALLSVFHVEQKHAMGAFHFRNRLSAASHH